MAKMCSKKSYLDKIANAEKYKVFVYVPEDAGKSRMIIKTRAQILKEFYDDWEEALIKVGKGFYLKHATDDFLLQKCIEDWILLNYAIPVFNDERSD